MPLDGAASAVKRARGSSDPVRRAAVKRFQDQTDDDGARLHARGGGRRLRGYSAASSSPDWSSLPTLENLNSGILP
jgi:hypothetical protein